MYVTVTHTTSQRATRGAARRNAERTSKTTALADLLRMAVDLNHARALKAGVRVRGYALDNGVAADCKRAVLKKLYELLGHAIRRAHRSSLVIAEVGLKDGEVNVRLRYARPGKSPSNGPTGLDWIDEIWSWDLAVASHGPH